MMKKIRFLFVLLFIFAVVSITPGALADDSDFSAGLRVFPEIAGYKGGEIRLRVTINNFTSKDITWIDFAVNTETPYNERWSEPHSPDTVPVPAYCDRTHNIEVHLSSADLDKDKFLSVAINNDGDANPDGVQIIKFRVQSTHDLAEIISTPEPGDFEVGETVTVMHQLVSHMEDPLTDAELQSFLLGNEDQHLVDSLVSHYSFVEMGDHAVTSTTYTLTAADTGRLTGAYDIEFKYLGETYSETGFGYSYNVNEAQNPDFTARLSAPVTAAQPDTNTTITLKLKNTGNVGFGSFDIKTPDGAHVADGGSVGPGGETSVSIPYSFTEPGELDVSYVVTGDYGWGEHTENTNTLHMVCETPDELVISASPEPTLSDSASPEPTLSGSVSPEAVESANDAAAPAEQGDNSLLYIIIGVLSAIILAGLIAIPLILRKKQRKE
jgi:hypothetical protein